MAVQKIGYKLNWIIKNNVFAKQSAMQYHIYEKYQIYLAQELHLIEMFKLLLKTLRKETSIP